MTTEQQQAVERNRPQANGVNMASEMAKRAAEQIAPIFKALYTQRDVDIAAVEIDAAFAPLVSERDALAAQVAELEKRLRCRGAVESDRMRRGGRPVLKGTRFTAQQLVAELASESVEEVADNFDLDKELVQTFCDGLADLFAEPPAALQDPRRDA